MYRDNNSRKRQAAGAGIKLILLIILCMVLYVHVEKVSSEVPDVLGEFIETKLEAAAELITYKYSYRYRTVKENTRSIPLLNLEIPGTTHTLDITYPGTIKAGFEIDRIESRIDYAEKKIFIHLPEAVVMDHFIDEEAIEYKAGNNILNPIDGSEVFEGLEEIKAGALEDARNQGLFEKAREEAEKIITAWLSGVDGFEVVFE